MANVLEFELTKNPLIFKVRSNHYVNGTKKCFVKNYDVTSNYGAANIIETLYIHANEQKWNSH